MCQPLHHANRGADMALLPGPDDSLASPAAFDRAIFVFVVPDDRLETIVVRRETAAQMSNVLGAPFQRSTSLCWP
jgi:hypothetical protein